MPCPGSFGSVRSMNQRERHILCLVGEQDKKSARLEDSDSVSQKKEAL